MNPIYGGIIIALVLILLFGLLAVLAQPPTTSTAPTGTYAKVRYVQYTDGTFTKQVPQPMSLGIMGPAIRGVVGDTIKIVFFNNGSQPYSVHPHGVRYDKCNEGAMFMGGPVQNPPVYNAQPGKYSQSVTGNQPSNIVASNYKPVTRTYYIEAQNVNWVYTPVNVSEWGYTPHNSSLAQNYQVGGTVSPAIPGFNGSVTFSPTNDVNGTTKPCTMNPDGTFAGDVVMPGQKYTYTWYVTQEAGPAPSQGSSTVWIYHDHVGVPSDPELNIYAGLFGPIIITDPRYANANATPNDVNQEFVTLFLIFTEHPGTTPKLAVPSQSGANGGIICPFCGDAKYAINGRVADNAQGFVMHQGDKVRWYVIGMGDELDLHTPQWDGQEVNVTGTTTDTVGLQPGSFTDVNMNAYNIGTWMLQDVVSTDRTSGMFTTYTILPKGQPYTQPLTVVVKKNLTLA